MPETEPTTKVPTDPAHAVRVSRDLAFEIAAVSAAILDTEEEKKEFTATIKSLKKRQRELIGEIRSSGDTQLVMNFGSTVRTEIALAENEPSEDDRGSPEDGDDDVHDEDDDVDDPTLIGDDEEDEATH